MTLPLAGIKVLDFTHVLAGPFGTRILGDLGADIVKVETAERQTGLTADHASPYFIQWNRSKRCLALNMAADEGREIGRALCARADIVIENFSPGVLDRWGLGYDAMRDLNPSLIYVGMPGMGNDGPWSSFVTFAPTIHALSGLTYLTSVPGREDIGRGLSRTCRLH